MKKRSGVTNTRSGTRSTQGRDARNAQERVEALRILALDTGTHCGWAWWDGARRESGVQVFDVKRGESPGMRYIRFNKWLTEFVDWCGGNKMADLILVYEQTHNRGGAATEVAAGFATRVQEAAARWGCDHIAIHSGTLKKWTTGSGGAGKPQMIAAVCRRAFHLDKPHDPCASLGDDEADALALLAYARAELVADSIASA